MIWGLDTGARKWHAVNELGDHDHEVIPNRVPTDVARVLLAESWNRFTKHKLSMGDIVICEQPLALQNGKTTIILSKAAGALHTVTFMPFGLFATDEIDWRDADVALWKRHICGRGNADKDEIEAWVRHNLGMEFSEPDHYDAACLVEFGKLWEMLGHMPEPLKKRGKK